VLLNNERPGYAPLTPQWVKGRLDLFHDTTLKSLLNQSFQDFRIWAICGQNNLDVTRGYGWHERVEPMYDKGEAALAGIDTEYVAVTRIDSDDLMHRDGMGEVHDRLDFANPGRVLVFRDNLAWNRLNGYIGYYYRTSPPFFTQLYPKKQHRDWVAFMSRMANLGEEIQTPLYWESIRFAGCGMGKTLGLVNATRKSRSCPKSGSKSDWRRGI